MEAICEAAKLSNRSQKKFNCSHEPLFPDIPLSRVIIDNLHLFLRVCDNLINLFIAQLRFADGLEKATSLDRAKALNMTKYEEFLNTECNIPFHFYQCEESKQLKWRDLNGPEKYRLFSNINLIVLFPNLQKIDVIQEIWKQFFKLNATLRSQSLSSDQIDDFESDAKAWIKLFLQVYQTRNVTPYMHAMSAHVPEFFRLHKAIVPFTQQGLEKLNDHLTQYYFRGSNHRGIDALKQVLMKKNRLEILEDAGCRRTKRELKCSHCGQVGHNKQTCPKPCNLC